MIAGCLSGIATLDHGKIYAVFSGDTLKVLDVLVAYFNVGNALTLPYKLFDGLLALARTVFGRSQFFVRFSAEFQEQFHGFGKRFPCQLAAFDNEANILLVNLVVIYNI